MRYAIVTETYPPDVNGVALTVHGLERGLRARGHQVQVVRPRHPADGDGEGSADELLVRGAPLPRYPSFLLNDTSSKARGDVTVSFEIMPSGLVGTVRVLSGTGDDALHKPAIDAVRRAGPFGDVSKLPRPWKFAEAFLFNDDRRFKPRTLDAQ